MENKICALFRQSWYEVAKKHLNDAERLQLYEAAFCYEFYEQEPSGLPVHLSVIFDMIRDDIDADRAKIIERRERNRLNGAKGGRPASNKTKQETTESNTNPNNPDGYSGVSYTNTNTSTNNILSLQKESNEKIEKYKIFLCFFEKGIVNYSAEYDRFIAYYTARGWKDKAGNAIENKSALAKLWESKGTSEQTASSRAYYISLLKSTKTHSLPLISDFLGCIIAQDSREVIIRYKTKEAAILFDNEVAPSIMRFIPRDDQDKPYRLSYQVLNN